MRTGLIDKDKNVAVQHTFAQLIADNAAQAVKAFAHIGFFAVQVMTPGISQGNNAAHANNSFKYDAATGWYILIPFNSANRQPVLAAEGGNNCRGINPFCVAGPSSFLPYRL